MGGKGSLQKRLEPKLVITFVVTFDLLTVSKIQVENTAMLQRINCKQKLAS